MVLLALLVHLVLLIRLPAQRLVVRPPTVPRQLRPQVPLPLLQVPPPLEATKAATLVAMLAKAKVKGASLARGVSSHR